MAAAPNWGGEDRGEVRGEFFVRGSVRSSFSFRRSGRSSFSDFYYSFTVVARRLSCFIALGDKVLKKEMKRKILPCPSQKLALSVFVTLVSAV